MDFWGTMKQGVRGVLRELGMWPLIPPNHSARHLEPMTPAPSPASDPPCVEVTAKFIWHMPWEDHPTWHLGRVLYATDPELAHDLHFLGRLSFRISELWNRSAEEPRTATESVVLGHILEAHHTDRRVQLPSEFSGCDSAFLHDVNWRQVEADIVLSDLNRSLRTLRLSPEGTVVELGTDDNAGRRARQRLRQLRRRGGIPVTALRIQANSTLYGRGDNDAPAAVVFSFSPEVDSGHLEALADVLYEMGVGNRDYPQDEELAAAVPVLAGSHQGWRYGRRARILRAGRPEAYVADLWIHRPFLRNGYIDSDLRELPCLAEPGDSGAVELLPWDEEIGSPVTVDPNWLYWNDGCVGKIARTIAEENAFGQLPILADALEEAGCTNVNVLDHCRRPGEHTRGCWVLELFCD